jgi:hypothetical protein
MWADKVIAVDFAPLPTGPDGLSTTALWNDYFDYVYAGYVEDLQTGHKEPLVWLQQLFSHRGHSNLEAAIDRSTAGISRMNSLSSEGNFKVVMFAIGFEDIIVESVAVLADGNAVPSIEQSSPFYVSGAGSTADFQDSTGVTVPGKQLHVGNLSSAMLADFAANNGVIQKGGADIDEAAYTLEPEGDGEIAITLTDAFFSGAFQGAYTLKINSNATVHPTVSFTVNRIIARPTLQQGSGAASGALEASPMNVTTNGGNIVFSNSDFASAIVTEGRGVSSIAPAATEWLKATGGVYYIDASVLEANTAYTLTILTSNFADSDRANLNTIRYYISY